MSPYRWLKAKPTKAAGGCACRLAALCGSHPKMKLCKPKALPFGLRLEAQSALVQLLLSNHNRIASCRDCRSRPGYLKADASLNPQADDLRPVSRRALASARTRPLAWDRPRCFAKRLPPGRQIYCEPAFGLKTDWALGGFVVVEPKWRMQRREYCRCWGRGAEHELLGASPGIFANLSAELLATFVIGWPAQTRRSSVRAAAATGGMARSLILPVTT